MPHQAFILAYFAGSLGCLVNTRRALGVLLVHKIQDSRLQRFLIRWTAALVILLGAGIRGFELMPILVLVGLFFAVVSLCAFIFWLASEDLFLKFVLEDEAFYDRAIQSHALSVFHDIDSSEPQRTKKGSSPDKAMSSSNLNPQLTVISLP
jgi:hypothetical protein